MKRQLPALALIGLALALGCPVRAGAQDPVAAAAREEILVNYQNLSSKVSRLEEELQSAQRQVQKLAGDNHRLRDELDRQKNRNENAATLERITKLQEAIKQVDEARLDDNKKVMAEIARIRTAVEKASRAALSSPPVETPDRNLTPPPQNNRSKPSDVGFEYVIKKGDTLSGIIAAAREQKGLKLTQKQMEDANPGVNLTKLRIGQKIFIPAPAP